MPRGASVRNIRAYTHAPRKYGRTDQCAGTVRFRACAPALIYVAHVSGCNSLQPCDCCANKRVCAWFNPTLRAFARSILHGHCTGRDDQHISPFVITSGCCLSPLAELLFPVGGGKGFALSSSATWAAMARMDMLEWDGAVMIGRLMEVSSDDRRDRYSGVKTGCSQVLAAHS